MKKVLLLLLALALAFSVAACRMKTEDGKIKESPSVTDTEPGTGDDAPPSQAPVSPTDPGGTTGPEAEKGALEQSLEKTLKKAM